VDVWATESVFVQVTVVPALTVRSVGLNPPRPSVDAPTGIVTDEADPAGGPPGAGAGAGIGEGDGVGDE
jgi:hypothetical protein